LKINQKDDIYMVQVMCTVFITMASSFVTGSVFLCFCTISGSCCKFGCQQQCNWWSGKTRLCIDL